MALSNGFVNAVGKLKQYPAANLIGEIQEASRIEGDAKAALIMDYLTQRVLNVPASYKVPLIYAIDAIVKSLRGNFVNELSKKLVNFYLICFRDVDDKDKLRLRAVLRTWQKQSILPSHATDPLYKVVQDWIVKNPDRVAVASGKKKRAVAPNSFSSTSSKLTGSLKPVGIDMSGMMQQQFQFQQHQNFQFQQQQAGMVGAGGFNPAMAMGTQNYMHMNAALAGQGNNIRQQAHFQMHPQHGQFNQFHNQPAKPYNGMHQQPQAPFQGMPPMQPNVSNMSADTQPFAPPKSGIKGATKQSNQAEMLLNMIGVPTKSAEDARNPVKITGSQNNNERNDNTLDSVLGFLKQAANDDAKPKVPKVPVKDVFGVPQFIQHVNRRNENIVQKLYGKFPYFCKTSGARLATEAEYNAHLDWVFKKKAEAKNSTTGDDKKIKSRSWYLNHEEWLSLRGNAVSDNDVGGTLSLVNQMLSKKMQNAKVVADDNFKVCPISKEKFELVYDEEIDEWIYKDAVQPDGPGTTIYSKHCYTKEKAEAYKRSEEAKRHDAMAGEGAGGESEEGPKALQATVESGDNQIPEALFAFDELMKKRKIN